MPLKRTPPATPEAGLVKTNPLLHRCESEPKLKGKKGEGNSSLKRKFEGKDDSATQSVISEMRILFNNFTSDQEKKFNTLNKSFEAMVLKMTDLTQSMEFMSKMSEEFEQKFDSIKKERSEDKAYIKTLEDRIEALERGSRNSSMEIRSVHSVPTETKSDLCDLVMALGDSLDIVIQKTDIRSIYRGPSKKNTPKPIVVEFNSAIMKEEVLSSCRKFNKGKKRDDKLNTRHLKIKGAQMPIYVSENLTFKSKKLFYLARDFAKTNGFAYCWTSNGVIYLRKKDNTPFFRITAEEDFTNLQNL